MRQAGTELTVEDCSINQHPKTISFEGGRGVGKTTVFNQVVSSLLASNPSCLIVTNRTSRPDLDIIDTKKNVSPIHQSALSVHQEWIDSFNIVDGYPIPKDPLKSFELSFSKFMLGVSQLIRESGVYKKASGSHDLTILDRDLDTVIAYSLAEMIVSNPDKLSDGEVLANLSSKLWRILVESLSLTDREIPDLTFYFETDNAAHTLDRGHQSKIDTAESYILDPFQERTQDVINMAYDYSFKARSSMFPDKKFYRINVDGKNVGEISQIVELLINRKEVDLYHDIAVLKIPTTEACASIDALIAVIDSNSSGARFPSKAEVSLYGASNCVYNNAALVAYGNHLGLGTFVFTEVAYSENINSFPVHWCALQLSDDRSSSCRVIDVTPFNPPYIGEWISYERSSDDVFILNDPKYTVLRIDSPEDVYDYMELANLIDRGFYVKDKALRLIESADNESKEIFALIRYSRLLVENDLINELNNLFSTYLEKYPSNLVLLREIAKNMINQSFKLTTKDIKSKFIRAWENVELVAGGMCEEEATKHLRYYRDIKRVIDLFKER